MSDQMLAKAAAKSLRITPAEKDRKPDRHKEGTVRSVNSDGNYLVALDESPETHISCAPYCAANVGDRVTVVLRSDGVNTAIGRLGGDLGGCSDDFPENDPTVPDWAKQPNPPTYTAEDVGAAPEEHGHDYLPLAGGTITGALTVDGSLPISFKGVGGINSTSNMIRLGNSTANDYLGLIVRSGSNNFFRPGANNAMDLGHTNYRWKDLYLTGNLTDGTSTVKVADVAKKSDVPTEIPISFIEAL